MMSEFSWETADRVELVTEGKRLEGIVADLTHTRWQAIHITELEAENVRLHVRVKELEAALLEAADEVEYSSGYKGEFLQCKHGDLESSARFRALARGESFDPEKFECTCGYHRLTPSGDK